MSYSATISRTGYRALDRRALAARNMAASFTGLPAGVTRLQVLAALRRAAPHLGISPALQRTIDQLFGYSNDRDWEAGRRPIVWPSNACLQEELCLSLRSVQSHLHDLAKHRLVVMKGSANGKRYGQRDEQGYIVTAFGIDLSPLAVRLQEFRDVVAAARAEQKERKDLQERISCTRAMVVQVAIGGIAAREDAGQSAASRACFGVADWEGMKAKADRIGRARSWPRQIGALRALLAGLGRLHDAALAAFAEADHAATCVDNSVDNGIDVDTSAAPKDAAGCVHIQQLQIQSSKKDTSSTEARVRRLSAPTPNASRGDPAESCKERGVRRPSAPRPNAARGGPAGFVDDLMATYRLTPMRLALVFPELGLEAVADQVGPSDIVEAAYHLGRYGLGINQHAWAEACRAIGRNAAAVAVCITAARAHRIETPGGYLRGMARRALTGNLYLGPSVYAIMRARLDKDMGRDMASRFIPARAGNMLTVSH